MCEPRQDVYLPKIPIKFKIVFFGMLDTILLYCLEIFQHFIQSYLTGVNVFCYIWADSFTY